jgi:hypothetical protein
MSNAISNLIKKRNENLDTKAGFIAGLISGLLIGIVLLIIIALSKEVLITEITDVFKNIPVQTTLSAQSLYYIALIASAPIMIFLYSILGIVFGLLCVKYKLASFFKMIGLCLLFGIILGLVTNVPIPRYVIVILTTSAWFIFGIIYYLIKKRNMS